MREERDTWHSSDNSLFLNIFYDAAVTYILKPPREQQHWTGQRTRTKQKVVPLRPEWNRARVQSQSPILIPIPTPIRNAAVIPYVSHTYRHQPRHCSRRTAGAGGGKRDTAPRATPLTSRQQSTPCYQRLQQCGDQQLPPPLPIFPPPSRQWRRCSFQAGTGLYMVKGGSITQNTVCSGI